MTGAKLRNSKSGCQQPLDDFRLFENRKDGACDADQTGDDGDSVACNREPLTFRKFQIGAPYRIDETQPCDDSAGERDPKCLDCSKGRGQSHSQRLPALCVEMVAAKFQRPGRGMQSTLKIELVPKTIADQHDHFEAVSLVDLAFVCDNYLPRIAIRSYRNRYIGGPIADVLHLDPYAGLELSGRLGWLLHSALPPAATNQSRKLSKVPNVLQAACGTDASQSAQMWRPARAGVRANSGEFGRSNRMGSHSENFSRWEIFALRANHQEALYPSAEVDGLHWFAVRTNWGLERNRTLKAHLIQGCSHGLHPRTRRWTLGHDRLSIAES
jgi:hypothetical protein